MAWSCCAAARCFLIGPTIAASSFATSPSSTFPSQVALLDSPLMSRFVRPSKYRHVYGNPAKPEASYLGVKASQNAWDTNLLAANKQYLSVNWQAGGGGAFAIIPTSRVGKLPDVYPLCRGHTATVLDTAFSPFDDSVVVSAADDGNLGIWKVDDSIFDVLDMSAKELESHGGVKDMEPRAKIDASGR